MPTTSGKSRKATKKSTSKKGGKGSKGTKRKKGGAFVEDPVIVTGGGSAVLKFNNSQFRGSSGVHRNANATPVAAIVDGALIPLTPTSTVIIRFA